MITSDRLRIRSFIGVNDQIDNLEISHHSTILYKALLNQSNKLQFKLDDDSDSSRLIVEEDLKSESKQIAYLRRCKE